MDVNEFEKLKLFFRLYVKWFIPDEQRLHGFDFRLDEFLANLPFSKAKNGLQMAVNDIIEMSCDWPLERVIEADDRFLEAGSYSLSEVRKKYSTKYKKIMKKGFLASDVELYFLKGILDAGNIDLDLSERERLEEMIRAFEEKINH